MALQASRLILLALCATPFTLNSQAQSTPDAAPVTRAIPPSQTLQPSIDVLKQMLAETHIDKWKASPAIRSEAQANFDSIQRDVQSTLPPLLAAADPAPDSTAKVFPVYRNVEALYDVMLRLVVAGRLAAPNDQMSALDQTLARLDDGRRALGTELQQDADAQELRVTHLEAALKAVPPPQPPSPPPAPIKCPVAPARKKVMKPATPPAASQTTPTPSQ
jgi:hypothetical protein